MRRGLVVAAALAAAGILAPPAARAQTEPWRFNGLRTGFCVEFLVDSARIRDMLPSGALPLRADRMQNLHPVIARTIQEQPEYGAWTPGSVCLYLFDEVVVGGRTLSTTKEAGELIGFVSYAARLLEDRGRGGDVLDALVSSNWKGMRTADDQGIKLERASVLLEPIPNSRNRRLTVKVGGTTLLWEGHGGTDSASTSVTLERRWVVKGGDRRHRLVTMRVIPASSQSMIGGLVVQGKDDLSKALRASPVRFMGPAYRGGNGELINEVPR